MVGSYMELCEVLSTCKDHMEFNGYLEDYVSMAEDLSMKWKEVLEEIVEIDPSIKIIVGLRLDINDEVVTNKIIRYKDAFKIKEKALYYPYILYGYTAKGEERAVILAEEYIRAKALYFCISEPMGLLNEHRNALVSCDREHLKDVIESLFAKDQKCGSVQRRLDSSLFPNYEAFEERVVEWSEEIRGSVSDQITGNRDRKEEIIKGTIVTWFLIKKVLYVQYMLDRMLLTQVHQGNIKEQRLMAKKHADHISFISMSELWKL